MTNQAMLKLIQNKYPDFRAILNTLQAYKIEDRKNITLEDIDIFTSVYFLM